MGAVRIQCSGVLLDLDGTLICSLEAVDRCWTRWCEVSGLQPALVLPRIHGRRSIDSLPLVAPHLDAEAEDAVLQRMEVEDTEGVRSLPGACELLNALPRDRWALVTSCARPVALARMAAAKLPLPAKAVFGDLVANGKPAPDPFLLGAKLLGEPADQCVAFEDTQSGVDSAIAAGMRTIGVGRLPLRGIVASIPDLLRVQSRVLPDGSVELQIDSSSDCSHLA